MPYVLPIPIVHWTILQPLVFIDVKFWVEPKNIVMLVELFNP
jgi:hypothetical protein